MVRSSVSHALIDHSRRPSLRRPSLRERDFEFFPFAAFIARVPLVCGACRKTSIELRLLGEIGVSRTSSVV